VNKRQRALWARLFLAAIDKLALKFARRLSSEFKRFWTQAEKQYDGGLLSLSDDLQISHAANTIKILDDLVSNTAKVFSVYTIPKIPTIDTGDFLAQGMIETLKRQSAQSATGIALTTVQRAQAIVARGIEQGLSQTDISKQLVQQVNISRSRAVMIARTEVHSASNAVTYSRAERAATELDETVMLEWISTNDGRVRPDHKRADGQKVKLGEPFNVGGAKMRRPSDPAGGAANVINCRCVLGFSVGEDE
jgi:SPP1 gp7 family putative phage head morphogenesis protein